MADYDSVDFFSDASLVEDPYPYFDHLRARCPVLPTSQHGVVAVTGYEEASEIYLNSDDFSSCNSVIGPFATFPVPLEGDDVGDLIDRYRDQLPMNEHMVTMDPPEHNRERSLIMRLLTPKRLKENEAFMWRLADRQIDEFVRVGSVRVHPGLRTAVRDARGRRCAGGARVRPRTVPRGLRVDRIARQDRSGGRRHGNQRTGVARRLVYAVHRGPPTRTTERRTDEPGPCDLPGRVDPRGDGNVVRTATFLFAAGQETTARLLAVALKYLAEYPELQDELRAHRDRIPGLHRGGPAHREPGQGRLSARPPCHLGRREWTSPPVRR